MTTPNEELALELEALSTCLSAVSNQTLVPVLLAASRALRATSEAQEVGELVIASVGPNLAGIEFDHIAEGFMIATSFDDIEGWPLFGDGHPTLIAAVRAAGKAT